MRTHRFWYLLTAGLVLAATTAMAVAVTPAAPAGAAPAGWTGVGASGDPAIGVVGNLNDPAVAIVDRFDGRVYIRRPGDTGWTDLGAPTEAGVAVRPTRLVTSAGKVFVGAATGVYRRTDSGWERIGEPAVDLLASRAGDLVMIGQRQEFRPHLYAVDASGRVLRFAGQWSVIGMDAHPEAGSLAERGGIGRLAKQYWLRSGRTGVVEWLGTFGTRVIGGPANSIMASNAQLIVIEASSGKLRAHDDVRSTWSDVASPSGPFRPGAGRYFIGAEHALGSTMYHLASDGKLLLGMRVRPGPGTTTIATSWRRLATDGMRGATVHGTASGSGLADIAVLTTTGHVRRFAWGEIDHFDGLSVDGAGVLGRELDFRFPVFGGWNGELTMTVDRTPPGLTWIPHRDGSGHLRGTPTVLGTFTYTVTGVDSSGSIASSTRTFATFAESPGFVAVPSPLHPVGTLTLFNCLRSGHTMPVWVRDRTAEGGWQRARDEPVPADGCGRDGLAYTPPAGHVVEVIAVDTGNELCAGDNPEVPACIAFTEFVTGDSTGFFGDRAVSVSRS